MALIDRQIRAAKETLELVRREYEQGKEIHGWRAGNCPLCSAFIGDCKKCPASHCVEFASEYPKSEGMITNPCVPLEDVAGFMQSLLITLKEM